MTDNPLEWGSHLPALFACLAVTDGPVLELGVGDYSTPALHAFCVSAGRLLVSIENDADWMLQLARRYESRRHRFIRAAYDNFIESALVDDQIWSVTLMDHSPGERRVKDFVPLLNRSDYVVVHDYHREIEEGIAPLLVGVTHHVCKDYQPPTLVASITCDMPDGLL